MMKNGLFAPYLLKELMVVTELAKIYHWAWERMELD